VVHGIENWKYDDRLKFLGLTRLDKRIRSDLAETFKILNGFYIIPPEVCPLIFFTEFTDASSRLHASNDDHAGMSRHRFSPYNAYYITTD